MGIIDYVLPKNPVTDRREFHFIPAFVENFVGASSFDSLVAKEGGEVKGEKRYVDMVQKVGQALAENTKRKETLKFEFKVIDCEEDNAWCLPGGKIGINIGLIKSMEKETDTFGLPPLSLEDKIAAVLSHEVIHADARHTGRSLEFRLFFLGMIKAAQAFVVHFLVHRSYDAQLAAVRNAPAADDTETQAKARKFIQLTKEKDERAKAVGSLFELCAKLFQGGLTLCNSRSHELESDRYGMFLIQTVRQNRDFTSPEAAIWLQHFFQKKHPKHDHKSSAGWFLNLFSTHPTPSERLAANMKTWDAMKV